MNYSPIHSLNSISLTRASTQPLSTSTTSLIQPLTHSLTHAPRLLFHHCLLYTTFPCQFLIAPSSANVVVNSVTMPFCSLLHEHPHPHAVQLIWCWPTWPQYMRTEQLNPCCATSRPQSAQCAVILLAMPHCAPVREQLIRVFHHWTHPPEQLRSYKATARIRAGECLTHCTAYWTAHMVHIHTEIVLLYAYIIYICTYIYISAWLYAQFSL